MPSVEKTEEEGVTIFHIRGREFVVRELEAGPYEDAVRSAAAASEDDDKTDMLVLEKLLVVDSVTVDGKHLDPEEWAKEKYPVYQRVVNEVKRLHWLDIETDEEKEARAKAAKIAARRAADDEADGKPKSKSDIPNS